MILDKNKIYPELMTLKRILERTPKTYETTGTLRMRFGKKLAGIVSLLKTKILNQNDTGQK